MVNANAVNAGSVCLNCADFHENLLNSGRFPRFKNPFKYNCKSPINRENAAEAADEGRRARKVIAQYQYVIVRSGSR